MNLQASDRRNFSGKCAVFGQLLVRESHSENQNSMYKQYRASPFWHAVVHIYVVQIWQFTNTDITEFCTTQKICIFKFHSVEYFRFICHKESVDEVQWSAHFILDDMFEK